jgi:hypothetical protein
MRNFPDGVTWELVQSALKGRGDFGEFLLAKSLQWLPCLHWKSSELHRRLQNTSCSCHSGTNVCLYETQISLLQQESNLDSPPYSMIFLYCLCQVGNIRKEVWGGPWSQMWVGIPAAALVSALLLGWLLNLLSLHYLIWIDLLQVFSKIMHPKYWTSDRLNNNGN